jgi:hypothetical protein
MPTGKIPVEEPESDGDMILHFSLWRQYEYDGISMGTCTIIWAILWSVLLPIHSVLQNTVEHCISKCKRFIQDYNTWISCGGDFLFNSWIFSWSIKRVCDTNSLYYNPYLSDVSNIQGIHWSFRRREVL